MLINIHTHTGFLNNGWTIQNRYDNFNSIAFTGCYSAGLHPWYIQQHWQHDFEVLANNITQKNIVAVGECGLDKVCNTDFALQQTVFATQINLANKINKPLIIHCVKAFDEVLQLLKQQKNSVPVIFHGFNKSKELALQLTGNGYYLSFGKALRQPQVQEVIKTVPSTKIFLETDDADISIENIYSLAATALQIDVNTLSLQLQKNAAGVFGNSFL